MAKKRAPAKFPNMFTFSKKRVFKLSYDYIIIII